MSSLTKVRITLKDPQGRVLAKHPFIVKLLHADIVGVTTVDKPVFSQTGLNGTVILELKPSDYIYSLEYSIRGQRVPAILKFKVPVSADTINIEDIYIDTNYETNDVLALVNELKAIKATVLQMMQEHPDLVTRVNHVANALDNLVSTVTNQGDGIDEILNRLSALDMATDSLIAITDDLVRDKADKYLFTELSTKLDNEVTRITGLINNIVTDLQADKLDLANFKLYIAAKFASIDTDLFKIKTDIVGLKTGQIDEGVFKKTITDELTVKWQNDIKGYDNNVQASLTDIRNVVATADSALAERINTTSAKVDNNTAEIDEVRKSYVTKDEAVAFVGDSLRAEWQGDAADMIDKLQIGGRNLIKQSEVMRGVSTVAPDIIPAYNIETGELSRITVYTLSGFVRVTDNVKGVTVGFKNVIDDAQSRISSNLTTVDNEWVFFKYTFATGTTTNHKGYVVVNHLGSTDTDLATVETKLMKLEIGVKATDWSPAVTDIDDKITVVTAQLDDFKLAQANKDGALTQRIENAESSVNDNKASIKSIEETYAKASEVGAISKSALEATWKGDIDNAVTAVTIGGKNYLDDGMFDKGYWQFYSDNNQVTGKSDGFKLSIDSTTNIATGEWYLSSLKSKTLGNIQSNKVHTISFTGYGDSVFGFLLVTVILRSKQNGVFVDKARVMFNVEDINNRYVRQFNTGNLINSEELQLVFQVKSQIGTLWLNEIQLEIGNKVSDWTLAPSDYLEEIKETKASLEEFKRVSASANEALAERVTIAESQIGVTSGKITTVESTVSNLSNTVTTMNTTMDSGFKNSTAQYNSLANTVTANQSSTVTSLNSLSTRIDNINPDLVVKSTITNGSTLDHANGIVVGNSPGWSYVEFMDVYENVSYIFRVTRLSASNFNLRVVWYNKSKQFISSVIHTVFEGVKTIQAPAGASYLRIAYSTTAAKFAITEIAASAAVVVSADLAEFKQSQATQNGAFANAITKNETAIGNNTSTLNTFANTYATKDAVGGLAKTALQSTWQADAQAKVDALIIGSRNLLLKSGVPYSGTSYLLKRYDLSDATLAANEDVTITIWGDLGTDTSYKFMAYNSGDSVSIAANVPKVSEGVYRITTKWIIATGNNYLNVYAAPNATKAYPITISKIKLERGNKGTDWTAAPEDAITEMATMNSSISSLSQTVSNNQTSTATQIGQLTSSVSSMQAITDRAEGYVENGILYVPSPLGASYSGAAGSNAGAIRISLPTNPINAMIRFTVDIFNYVANTSNSYEISGYVNSTASPWLQNTAVCTGAANRAFPVRFGTDGTGKACVWIGNLDSTWSYCRVKVRDLTVGYANLNKELWRQGWNITFVTTYNTVTATVNPFNGEKAAADVSASLDTYKTTQAGKDTAQTLAIDNAVSRVGTLEGSVSNITSTYAKKTEVGALAKSELQTTWKSDTSDAISAIVVGSRNYLLNSQTSFDNKAIIDELDFTKLAVGSFISVSFDLLIMSNPPPGSRNRVGYEIAIASTSTGILYVGAWANGMSTMPLGKHRISNTVKVASKLTTNPSVLPAYTQTGGTSANFIVSNVKLELASIASDWSPAPEDTSASISVVSNAVSTINSAMASMNTNITALQNSGGDNLIEDGDFQNGLKYWDDWGASNVTRTVWKNNYGVTLAIITDNTAQYYRGIKQAVSVFRPDTQITVSFNAYSVQNNPVMGVQVLIHQRGNGDNDPSLSATVPILYNSNKRYSVTFTTAAISGKKEFLFMIGLLNNVAGSIVLSDIQLEYGSSASVFKPSISNLAKRVNATWSVTTEAVGARKAVAGLSLGVDGTTGESTFLVKANKFEIVDSNNAVRAAFINDGLNPGLIVNGSITADHIAARTITAAKIATGAITANEIAASTITGGNIAANQTITSPVINGGTVTGSSIVGGNLNIGSGVFTVDSQGNVKLTKGQINIANNFIVDADGNMTAKSGVFGGSVSADSIDTPVAQTYFADVGSYTAVFPPSKHLRRMFITTFSVSVIYPPSWNHDGRGDYTIDIKIYYKSPAGVETLLDRFGCVYKTSAPVGEQYTTYGSPMTRTIPNYEVDVPLEGGSYKVDVYTKWKFENSTYTNANTTLGQDEYLRTSERTGTRIGHITRRLMQYNLYRKV